MLSVTSCSRPWWHFCLYIFPIIDLSLHFFIITFIPCLVVRTDPTVVVLIYSPSLFLMYYNIVPYDSIE